MCTRVASKAGLPSDDSDCTSSGSSNTSAVPEMRSVSPVAGTRAIRPILPLATMFDRPKARLLPTRSGISSVLGSSTRMKPGSSPLGETSMVPSSVVVPINANGQRLRNSIDCSSSASRILLRVAVRGSAMMRRRSATEFKRAMQASVCTTITPIRFSHAQRAKHRFRWSRSSPRSGAVRHLAYPQSRGHRRLSFDNKPVVLGSGGRVMTVRFTRRAFVGAAAATTLAGPSVLRAAEPLKFRWSLDTAPSHPRNQAVVDYVGKLEKASNGTLKGEVFHSGQLFADLNVSKALLQGQVEIASPGAWTLTGLVPDCDMVQLPYFYGVPLDVTHKATDGKPGEHINKQLEAKLGSHVLGPWIDLGYQNWYATKTPLEKFADLKGLKI